MDKARASLPLQASDLREAWCRPGSWCPRLLPRGEPGERHLHRGRVSNGCPRQKLQLGLGGSKLGTEGGEPGGWAAVGSVGFPVVEKRVPRHGVSVCWAWARHTPGILVLGGLE